MSLRRRNLLAFGVLLLGIFLLLALTSVSAAQSQIFAYINITNGTEYPSENITFMENNWIKLHKEVEVDMDIPGLTFIYNGFNSAGPYSKDGRTITIIVNVSKDTDHKVHYPFKKHQFFYNDSTVYATLETDLMGTYYYYIASTYPTQVKEIAEMLVDGNTTKFRALFQDGTSGTLDANVKKTIGTLAAGDYVMIVTDVLLNEPDFGIIAATGIEVLEYVSKLTAPPHPVRRGDDLEVTMTLTAAPTANYRYGGALIREKDYVKSHEIRLESPGNKDGTNITFDGVSFVENWKIMGVGLTNIDAATIKTKISDILSAGGYEGAVCYQGITTSISQNLTFTTNDLPLGTYILSVGVWQTGSNRLVAFAQTKIVVASERAEKGKEAKGAETGTVTAGNVSFTEPAISETLKSIRFTNTTLTGTINVSSYDKDNNPSLVTPDVTKIKTPVGYLIIEVPPEWKIESAYIDFNVSLADLSAAGIDKTEVKLYKLDDTWAALPTTYNGDVDGYATYTADVTSWSIFAIAAAQPPPTRLPRVGGGAAAVPTPTPTPVVTPTPTPTPVVTPTPTPVVTPTPTPPVTPTPTPALPFPVIPLFVVIAIVVVVIIVAVAYVVLRRRKS